MKIDKYYHLYSTKLEVVFEEIPNPERRGRWLEGKCFECSECKARAAFAIFSKGDSKENVALELLSKYCPNCGAKMEEQE